MGLVGSLGDHLDRVAVGLDADGLRVDVAGVLAAVLVEEVERVARELHAAGLLALGEEGILGACKNITRYVLTGVLFVYCACPSIFRGGRDLCSVGWALDVDGGGGGGVERTGHLPDEVGADVLE